MLVCLQFEFAKPAAFAVGLKCFVWVDLEPELSESQVQDKVHC
jgi:hypothetical protein